MTATVRFGDRNLVRCPTGASQLFGFTLDVLLLSQQILNLRLVSLPFLSQFSNLPARFW
jgi:hypothetical protein